MKIMQKTRYVNIKDQEIKLFEYAGLLEIVTKKIKRTI